MDEHKTVYICCARGSAKVETRLRLYKKLIDDGYKLEFVRPAPFSKLQGRRIKPIIVDKDILRPDQLVRAELILNRILKGEVSL